MINKKRIVPIQKMDFLSMIGTILTLIGTSFAVVASATVEGNFTVTGSGAAGNFLADQPVQTLDFASGVTSATVYFVAAYDFSAITVNGSNATIASAGLDIDDINKDGITLYKAALSSGEVTISAVTPIAT